MNRTLLVYNLEFPSYCSEINIRNYCFSRIEDYENQIKRLQYRVRCTHEYTINANTGVNAITSKVTCPDVEEPAILAWNSEGTLALSDIELLLSIFTGREVFTLEREPMEGEIITSDPRQFQYGSTLITSIPYKEKRNDNDPLTRYNIGFQNSINAIYELIRSEEWQRTYEKGFFLFLAKSAFKAQILETSFALCWTIWEHLFAILNRSWMSDKQIRQLNSDDKISFILVKFALAPSIDNNSRKGIQKLSSIRNRLVHFGRFSDSESQNNAIMFIRLTEFVIAKILGLAPSNILNTMEDLEKFLND